MPDLLATATELESFLELDSGTIDTDRAELFLELAGGEVRAFTGRTFDAVEDEQVILDGTGTSVLELPEAPVRDVTEVLEAYGTDDVEALDGPDSASPVWEWRASGVLRRVDGGVFTDRSRWYAVTFDHGFAVAVPDEVRSVVLRMAARTYNNPDGIRQETIGRYSYTVAGEAAGMGLYAPDRRSIEHLRIRRRDRDGTPAAGS